MTQLYLVLNSRFELILQTKDADAAHSMLRGHPTRKLIASKDDLTALPDDKLQRLYRVVSDIRAEQIVATREALVSRFWKFLKPRG